MEKQEYLFVRVQSKDDTNSLCNLINSAYSGGKSWSDNTKQLSGKRITKDEIE